MSLRPDRRTIDTDIRYFMNQVATRGGVVCHSISAINPSGVANDQSENTVAYAANPSGLVPVGVLMNDMVNLDLTRQHYNQHKDEVQLGGKVTINPICTVTTDFVYPGHSPLPGTVAYVAHSGYLATSDVIGGCLPVGRFITRKDEDGFATVSVNLPVNI